MFNRYFDTQGRRFDVVTDSGGLYMRDDSDYPGFVASRRRYDFLGRTVYETVPAYGGGTLTTSNAYDTVGRLVLSR